MNWKWVSVLVLMFLLVVFAVQNYAIVEIRFFFWGLRTSRAMIIFATFLLGIAVGWLICAIKKRHD